VTELLYADTPGGQLAYVRRGPWDGSGEPLLLIMGVGGHHGMWSEPFLARLAERFDVIAFDHRGIGDSARAEEPFTIGDLAADALAVMDHVDWETAHVLGISMGGTVAQELALTAPGRVRSLVLGCTWPGPLPAGGAWGSSVLDLASAATSDPLTAAKLMFEANVSSTYAEREGAFEEFAEVAGAVTVPGPVILLQMQAATAHDAVDRLGDLDVPTLVIHGTEDRVIRPEAGSVLASLVRGVGLELIDGVGHLFFWEQPELSAELVIKHCLSR
jgi:3-oxoadipate enol-lactonase